MTGIGGPELLFILIWLALEILFVGLVASLAAKKGYNPWVWGILAFFFSLLTFIIVLVLPDRGRGASPGDASGS